jgi:L-rhamnose mutarotase
MENSIEPTIIRKGFVMSVEPGKEAEYARRHEELWPEMEALLLDHGVRTYSIFFHERTHLLFAYVEVESEERWNLISHTEICRKWWEYMAPIMPHNIDCSPKSDDLTEVFHLTKSIQ